MNVRDDGSPRARIVLIGEAPGKHEMATGRPFVGPSGGRLEVWWRMFGLSRSDFYITNVVPYQPENIERVPADEMQGHIARLHDRLKLVVGPDDVGPVIIVPTGNYALYALTGKGKVSWHRKDGRHERSGILDWRGSILSYDWPHSEPDARPVKVIPTLHPAFILRSPGMERWALRDWKRIADELETYETNVPKRFLQISPTIEDVELFVDELIAANKPVSLDIETPKGRRTEFQMIDGTWKSHVLKKDVGAVLKYKSGKKKGEVKSRSVKGGAYLGCIGMANDPLHSLTVPLTLDYWKTRERLARAKRAVNRLLASPVEKIMQNGMFDASWLVREGYELNGWRWDTRSMHHALDPRDDHDLASMASYLTRQPFWKHEAKDPEEVMKYAHNNEALWTYNGIDVCATLEIFYALKQRLEDEGLDDFYQRHYANMHPVLLDMGLHGINIDDERRAKELDVLNSEAAELQGDITEIAGMPLVAKKGLSNDRLKFLFYGAKGFEGVRAEATFAKLQAKFDDIQPFNLTPVRKKNTKGAKSITVDEVTIRKLVLKYPTKLGTLGPKLLEYRRNRKKAEFLDGKALDKDRRLRCQFSVVTEAGRLASHGTAWGTGRNLQNIDRELRYVFIPDYETLLPIEEIDNGD